MASPYITLANVYHTALTIVRSIRGLAIAFFTIYTYSKTREILGAKKLRMKALAQGFFCRLKLH